MANSGKNSNTSQFFIVLANDPSTLSKLNGKGYVAFGKVVEDNSNVLSQLDEVGVMSDSETDARPRQTVIISNCGTAG